MPKYRKGVEPLPVPTPISQPFWDAARQHRLALQRPPRAVTLESRDVGAGEDEAPLVTRHVRTEPVRPRERADEHVQPGRRHPLLLAGLAVHQCQPLEVVAAAAAHDLGAVADVQLALVLEPVSMERLRNRSRYQGWSGRCQSSAA